MAVIDINWNPSRRDLRVFAALQALFFSIVCFAIYRRTGSLSVPLWIWSMSAALGLIGLLAPGAIRYYYLAWMTLTWPIGWVVSHVILAIVYFGVFVPFGLVMRLFGRDPMQRKFAPSAKTYWIVRKPPESIARYFRQF